MNIKLGIPLNKVEFICLDKKVITLDLSSGKRKTLNNTSEENAKQQFDGLMEALAAMNIITYIIED